MYLQLGWGVPFASNLYSSFVSFRTVFVYFCHGDRFSSQRRLPGLIVKDRLFSVTIPLSLLGSMSRSISSLLLHPCLRFVGPCLFSMHPCLRFVGPCLFLIHSCELDISIIMYVFGKVVFTTAFYICSVIIKTSPHWSSLVCYVYF